MKKKLLAVLLSVAMVVGLTACGETKNNTTSTNNTVETESYVNEVVEGEDAVYRMLYSSEISTMNYLISGSSADQAVAANTVDTLIDYDSNGTMVPGLAESWSYDEATMTWTFNLRADQKWLDNTGAVVADVTAQEVQRVVQLLNAGIFATLRTENISKTASKMSITGKDFF